MAEKIKFELVSPERLLVDAPVDMVVVPGEEGDFGVLAGHAPLIATVRPGIIDIHNDGTVSERIFVGGGFAEVRGGTVTVLADEATPVGEIDRAAATRAIQDLTEKLSAADPGERPALTRRLAIAEARLSAAGEAA